MNFKQFAAATLLLAPAIACTQTPPKHAAPPPTTVTRTEWGRLNDQDNTPIQIYTLTDRELTVKISTFGARIIAIEAPDRTGRKADVVLGYDDVASYEADTSTYFGAIVGRYGNRIKKGEFTLDGTTYHVPVNNNGNALHGGPAGYSTRAWMAHILPGGLELSLDSADGDMGFPGELKVRVHYMLDHATLHIIFTATTSKPTVLNLTNHSYFNLAGDGRGTILNEQLMIPADKYIPTDTVSIPTGQLAPVQGTPFDFTTPTAIGARINTPDPQLKLADGYDHTLVFKTQGTDPLHVAAVAFDPTSGRTLTIRTTEPAVQFYTGNFLAGQKGKYGVTYQKYSGFCLETQHFPDSPNEPSFPSTVLRPGETFRSVTEFTFGVR
jgi:aldose 1-epimerase